MPIQTASQAYTNEGIGGFSFRNKIINGAMEIDQRNAGSAVTISDQYTLDRWSAYENTDGTFTVQRSTDAPTGFVNSLLASITSADSSLSTNQQIIPCRQWLEGTIIRDLAWGTANAKPITVSFWVKSSITGTYGFTISNDAGDRVYGQTYTISTANTWEYKTATIPGPTGGTWPTTTGRGAIITWSLGAGSSPTIASNGSWITPASATATYAVVGQTNVVATNGASWYITGVQLETGSVATPFELRPFGMELQLCQRYCYVQRGVAGDRLGFGFCGTATLFNLVVPLPVTMRTAPTLVSCSAVQVNDNQQGYNSSAIAIGDQVTNTTVNLKVTSSSMTIGRGAQCYFSPDAGSMILSAEL
jgi:hypothetical protein